MSNEPSRGMKSEYLKYRVITGDWSEDEHEVLLYCMREVRKIAQSYYPVKIAFDKRYDMAAQVLLHRKDEANMYTMDKCTKNSRLMSKMLYTSLPEHIARKKDSDIIISVNGKQPWFASITEPCPIDKFDLCSAILHELVCCIWQNVEGDLLVNSTTSSAKPHSTSEGSHFSRWYRFLAVEGDTAGEFTALTSIEDELELFKAITSGKIVFLSELAGHLGHIHSPDVFNFRSSLYRFRMDLGNSETALLQPNVHLGASTRMYSEQVRKISEALLKNTDRGAAYYGNNGDMDTGYPSTAPSDMRGMVGRFLHGAMSLLKIK